MAKAIPQSRSVKTKAMLRPYAHAIALIAYLSFGLLSAYTTLAFEFVIGVGPLVVSAEQLRGTASPTFAEWKAARDRRARE
jgi:hypothetical protein